MEGWISLITDLGFPIAITFFQLFKLDKSLQDLKEEIRNLSREIRDTGK